MVGVDLGWQGTGSRVLLREGYWSIGVSLGLEMDAGALDLERQEQKKGWVLVDGVDLEEDGLEMERRNKEEERERKRKGGKRKEDGKERGWRERRGMMDEDMFWRSLGRTVLWGWIEVCYDVEE